MQLQAWAITAVSPNRTKSRIREVDASGGRIVRKSDEALRDKFCENAVRAPRPAPHTHEVMMRCLILFILFASECHPATVDFLKFFQGNGKTSIGGVVSDSEGNVYIAGTTTSFDLPVKNAFQPRNPGAPIVISRDGGSTWVPGGNIPEEVVISPLVLSSPENVLLTIGLNGVYRSGDQGETWKLVYDVKTNRQVVGYVDSIDYDRRNPSIVYVSASGGVLKSADGGNTWRLMKSGLTPGACCLGSVVSVDPFRGTLYFTLEDRAYASTDAAETWKAIVVPAGLRHPRIVASPWMAGAAYLYSYEGAYQSTDGGVTWSPLTKIPTARLLFEIVLHPTRSGRIYARTWESLYRSDDGGLTWMPLAAPIEPSLGGTVMFFRPGFGDGVFVRSGSALLYSSDAGLTWTPWKLQREVYGLTFDPSNADLIYAGGQITADAFVAKLTRAGEVEFLTYLGGQGSDGAVSLVLDGNRGVIVGGQSTSADFPGANGQSYTGLFPTSFIAKISASGSLLYSTLLDEIMYGVAAAPDGSVPFLSLTSVRRLSADGSGVDLSVPLSGKPLSIATDRQGNIVAGTSLASRSWIHSGRKFSVEISEVTRTLRLMRMITFMRP